MKKIIGFFRQEDGASATEYALMLALIATVIIAGATALGLNSNTRFLSMAGRILSAGQ